MNLATWNFTILEEVWGGSMNVIDVMISGFFEAKAATLRLYKPGSTVADFRPLSEEELQRSKFIISKSSSWVKLIRLLELLAEKFRPAKAKPPRFFHGLADADAFSGLDGQGSLPRHCLKRLFSESEPVMAPVNGQRLA